MKRIPAEQKKINGYSLIELLIALGIIVILVGALTATLGPFGQRRKLGSDIFKLFTDLRTAQQFSRVKKDSYKYYGVRFYGGLGGDDRDGYKIVRYDPPGGVDPLDMNPQTDLDLNRFTIIQSSEEADTPEFLENTFFDSKVGIDATSEFQIGDAIIFTPEGSATSDGYTLLPTTDPGSQDEIVLFLVNGEKAKITITPLTGYLKIQ